MIYISPSQLTTWAICRESYRQSYLLGPSAHPSVFMAFGSCIHRMAFAYWAGWEYEKAFSWAVQPALYDKTEAEWKVKFETEESPYTTVVYPHGLLARNSFLDRVQLSAKEIDKWNERLDSLAKLTTHYFSYHGNLYNFATCETGTPGKITTNERIVQFPHSDGVLCTGIIDRISDGKLVDTKTVTPVSRDWKVKEKEANIRKPQMNFYLEWCRRNKIEIKKVIIEAVVRPYKGSEPDLVELDITDAVFAQHERFLQQMNWAISEMVNYIQTVRDAVPWPMNRDACAGKYSECPYTPLCDLKKTNEEFVRDAL